MPKMPKTKKTHRYLLTIEFECELPVKAVRNVLIQFENGLPYFVETSKDSVNNSFVYGTGKAKLKKMGTGKTES